MEGLSTQEKQRYRRHLSLNEVGESGQLALKNAKVLVVGAGGIGCPVLQYLAAAGVGTLGIIDGDVVESSNLQRQILFNVEDVGSHKADTAASKLQRMNPLINFKVYKEFLTKENALDLFIDYDIIVDGSDNFPTRYLVNDAAVLTQKPLVFGSIFKFEGQVSVFNYNNGPTYRCLFPDPPQPNEVPSCSEVGVMGTLPGVIGLYQANEVIKIICGIGEVLSGKLLTLNILSMSQNIFDFEKSDAAKIDQLEKDYPILCGLEKGYQEITWTEFNKNKSEYCLLDIREEWERELNEVGGIHISLSQLPEKWTSLPNSVDLIVYCESGIRSEQAIEFLKEMGYPKSIFKISSIKV